MFNLYASQDRSASGALWVPRSCILRIRFAVYVYRRSTAGLRIICDRKLRIDVSQISYLLVVVGLRFAAVEAGIAQFFYLILFSYALFNEGFSGLSITIGSIVTLYVATRWTAKIDWNVALARKTVMR